MSLTILPLTVATAADFFDFFDNRAFTDNDEWSCCYCTYFHMNDDSEREVDEQVKSDGAPDAFRRALRSRAERFISDGTLRGYLAYEDGVPVGFCNANDKSVFIRHINETPSEEGVRAKCTACFVIAPEYRGRGIATALLDRVLSDAASEGYAAVEGYPKSGETGAAYNFTGPESMYERAGFERTDVLGEHLLMRKRLSPYNTADKSKLVPTNSEHEEIKSLDISDIKSLFIEDIKSGYKIELTRPNTTDLAEQKYKEICLSSFSSTFGQAVTLAQSQTDKAINHAAKNGRLFTTKAPVSKLMQLKDGTVTSAVMNHGKIEKQVGFEQVKALGKANPAAVVGASMQAMALVSGEYYKQEISKQLKNINDKLDRLAGYHHKEKMGILRTAHSQLSKIIEKKFIEERDVDTCITYAQKCEGILNEYLLGLDELEQNHPNETITKRWINKNKEQKELEKDIDKNELDRSIKMCYWASELYEKCKLAEIFVRMRLGEDQKAFVEEQIEALQKSSAEAFHRTVDQRIESYYAPYIEYEQKIQKDYDENIDIQKNQKSFSENIKKVFSDKQALGRSAGAAFGVVRSIATSKLTRKPETENAQKKMEDLQTEFAQNNSFDLLEQLGEPKEFLILLGDNSDDPRVFVLDNEEPQNYCHENNITIGE